MCHMLPDPELHNQLLIKRRQHLSDLHNLGFAAGTDVEVVGNTDAGMIIAVKGSRVALNRGMASKITVNR